MPYAPENFDSEPSAFCYAFGQNFQTASYYRLDPLGTRPDRLLKEIKGSLAAGYPLMFGFTVYDSLGEAKDNQGKVPFPAPQDRTVGGHAIAAVGYDDGVIIQNSEPGSVPTRGAIRIRNSWGTGWGVSVQPAAAAAGRRLRRPFLRRFAGASSVGGAEPLAEGVSRKASHHSRAVLFSSRVFAMRQR
jgi:hypothetical protein